ncbi:ADP-ribosylation factor-like protein 2-binding protein isoform X1 [Sapajus apella]|uniref:ADP-ribosylation factor-like protein 2-binding protein n=1 Tax=Sapajus apella TaxID=9515 RepID=A0A6J3ICC0_SAPAP|nr:ADP-ribosylation factor-like protein 2-binding protein isoform X1 [Sapajus apella]
MDALEEESFALSFSSASDAEFDAVVGYLEDIIMDDEFQLLQRNFMDKYYLEFEDTEENKLTYTPIFNEYISLVEKYIEEQLLERIPGFNMAAFTTTLQHHKDEVAGDIFDMLLTFTDFLAFKEMFLDYRAGEEFLSPFGPHPKLKAPSKCQGQDQEDQTVPAGYRTTLVSAEMSGGPGHPHAASLHPGALFSAHRGPPSGTHHPGP